MASMEKAEIRVLYGVNGEGMGHATRSEVVIESLLSDHDVRVVASGAAFRHLRGRLPQVSEIFGPSFAMDEGEIRRWETVRQNVDNAVQELPDTVRRWVAEVSEWQPDVVVTDFEPLAGVYARATRTPLIAVDNINMLDRCAHDEEIVGGEREDFLLARAVTRSMVPGAVQLPGHHLLPTAARARGHHPGAPDRPPGDRRREPRARRAPGRLLERGPEADRGAALDRADLPRLRHAGRARRDRDRREPGAPSPLQRGLRRVAAHRARGGGRGRLLADERGRLPAKADPGHPAPGPVRAADERALRRTPRLRRLRHRGHPRGASRFRPAAARVRRGASGLRAGRERAHPARGARAGGRGRLRQAPGAAPRQAQSEAGVEPSRPADGRPGEAHRQARAGRGRRRGGRLRLVPRPDTDLAALRPHHLPGARGRAR